MEARKYQVECLDSVWKEIDTTPTRRMLVVMATGTGKTIVFSQLWQRLGFARPMQMLVLAHRDELIQQAIDKMRLCNPELKVGIEMAEQYADEGCDVIIASVATLGRKGSKRIERFDWNRIAVIITDEAHHSTASTYMNIYEYAGLFAPDNQRLLLGFTATPNRGDGEALGKVYQKIVYNYPIRKAIEDGWLTDIKGIKLRTATSLDPVHTVAGEFNQAELATAVNTPQRNQQIVKAWLEHARGRQTIIFCVDIQHSKDLAEMFRNYEVTAEAVWGDDPLRKTKLAGHKEGKISVLCNCGVLIEGYDDWRVDCVVIARPTKSQTLFTQMAGRGTRIEDGIGNVKEWLRAGNKTVKSDCLIIDVVDNASRHSLITLPTLLGLNPKLDVKGKSLIGCAKTLEAAAEANPSVDFSTLEDIDKIKAHIESVNFWDVKFPPEVEQNSQFSWHRAADGSFVLLLPDKERVVVQQNTLDRWEILASIKGQKYRGERATIEEAFQVADNLINEKAPETRTLLNRQEKWHDAPMTGPQERLLKRFLKGRPLPEGLTKGQAHKLISNLIAEKINPNPLAKGQVA